MKINTEIGNRCWVTNGKFKGYKGILESYDMVTGKAKIRVNNDTLIKTDGCNIEDLECYFI